MTSEIITIGDIHGRSQWKDIVFGGSEQFLFWMESKQSGQDVNYAFLKLEKIIFLGDYCDSYDKSNEEILNNLKHIVYFAKSYPDLVVLLLGNHDIQYILPKESCSGYRPEMAADLGQIFKDESSLFRIAYLDKFDSGKKQTKTLWTHAGVTYKWLQSLKNVIDSPGYRHREFFEGSQDWEIDRLLNTAWKLKTDCLFDVDADSGGFDLWAGPLWVRPRILNEFYLKGYDQVVGHTPQQAVTQYCPLFGIENDLDKLDTITYADALAFGEYDRLKRFR